ncbi:hypothetical protein ACFOW1_15620 [Parasediminibacterium paludis]|uniref:Uncharacterized protein n=1 Tax=Parasediminibacterium paludis TaxID=908966 RepID=A0ABV8Q1H1_9BACT
MKKITSIQLKAMFLFTVFALNTVVGFACAMGVDMGFNKSHHHEDEQAAVTPSVHTDADGKKHEHHHKSTIHHHENNEANGKGGCCNDAVVKFQNVDKALSQNVKASLDAPVFVPIISTCFGIDLLKMANSYPEKYHTRFFYPPPPDIRIAIQSFQI